MVGMYGKTIALPLISLIALGLLGLPPFHKKK